MARAPLRLVNIVGLERAIRMGLDPECVAAEFVRMINRNEPSLTAALLRHDGDAQAFLSGLLGPEWILAQKNVSYRDRLIALIALRMGAHDWWSLPTRERLERTAMIAMGFLEGRLIPWILSMLTREARFAYAMGFLGGLLLVCAVHWRPDDVAESGDRGCYTWRLDFMRCRGSR